MSSNEENGTFAVEIATVTQEQYDKWREASRDDNRSFSSWARVELDKAAEKQLAKGAA